MITRGQDDSEEQSIHGEDGGSRDDALAAIQDALRQMAARVENLAAKGGARGGQVRPPTPPHGRMPAYSADDVHSDAGRSDDGRSSASTMDPLDGVAGGPVGPPGVQTLSSSTIPCTHTPWVGGSGRTG